jgi:glycosyltransferase involved in cell wall biosynthesis
MAPRSLSHGSHGKATRLCIYTDTEWGLGEWARGLAAHAPFEVALRDWAHATTEDVAGFDLYLTLPSTAHALEERGISSERIAVVAHDESDLQRVLLYGKPLDAYRGYAVVSDSLACSSLTLGIARVPAVLRLGVDFLKFYGPLPSDLRRLGYMTVMSRTTESGVERKRGHLARVIADKAGLEFVQSHTRVSSEDLPAKYWRIDALVMTSLQEGAGQPPLEAAAAGRLVLGTPVGQFPRLANDGIGFMGPLGPEEFVEFSVEKLLFMKANPQIFREACIAGQRAAKDRDWSVVAPEWMKWLASCGAKERVSWRPDARKRGASSAKV